jgi:predicted GIY-YIG superfamily endonuclease
VDGGGRRSIYQAVNRNFLNPFMITFDTPQPATAVARRSRSNVPAQALIMLNSDFVHDQSAVWARRLIATTPPDSVVDTAWQEAFGRRPEAVETESVMAWLDAVAAEQSMTRQDALKNEAIIKDLCHTLLNKKELIYLE